MILIWCPMHMVGVGIWSTQTSHHIHTRVYEVVEWDTSLGDKECYIVYRLCACFIYIRYYSPDINPFWYAPALNPDSSIHMNHHYSPWFFVKFGLCFVEDAIFGNKYFVTNMVIVVNTPGDFPGYDLLVIACDLQFSPVSHEQYVKEHISSPRLVRLWVLCGTWGEWPKLCCLWRHQHHRDDWFSHV
jgi:hypothetical protein